MPPIFSEYPMSAGVLSCSGHTNRELRDVIPPEPEWCGALFRRRVSLSMTLVGWNAFFDAASLSLVLFWPTHNVPVPSCGNFEHSKFSGQSMRKFFITVSQARALSHKLRHGGIGWSRIVHNGTYNRHKKNCKSGLQPTLTSGANWNTS